MALSVAEGSGSGQATQVQLADTPSPDWEKERLLLVQPDIWRCYRRSGRHDLRPVYQELTRALDSLQVRYRLLTQTEAPLDIWIRDWGFVDQYWFHFSPSYAGKLYRMVDVDRARRALSQLTGVSLKRVPLVLDGGNLVHSGKVALVTEKVFEYNPHLSRLEVERTLCSIGFQRVVFLPVEPGDVIGHADGMVRFLTQEILLFNDYTGSSFVSHRRRLLATLRKARLGVELVPFPWYYTHHTHDGVASAEGYYINFIQTKQGIIYPTFRHRFDDRVGEVLASHTSQALRAVEALPLAQFGGVLNCASLGW